MSKVQSIKVELELALLNLLLSKLVFKDLENAYLFFFCELGDLEFYELLLLKSDDFYLVTDLPLL